MPRLSEATSRSRREQIAAAAMRCFARYGFTNTSMADIIKESGLSNGAIYSHFANKSELVRFTATSLLESRTRRFAEDITAAQAELTPGQVFARIVTDLVDRTQAKILIQIWAEVPRDDELAAVARHNLDRLHRLLVTALLPWARAQLRGANENKIADRTADAILAAIQGYVVRLSIDPEVDPTTLAEGIADALG
ncbi:TetR/AcrR family transcriptional regulator [Rhodococcus sp. NPDC003318]|uniref:TetR/AcrR family transcriptional regulator n=1 Tax=Rhodococcus sp. NPDC003318 TaxID=3364503 RepID=UPI0036ADBC22